MKIIALSAILLSLGTCILFGQVSNPVSISSGRVVRYVINDGDSLSLAQSFNNSPNSFQTYALSDLAHSFLVTYNVAVGGIGVPQMISGFNANISSVYTTSYPFIVVIEGGANDIRGGTAAGTIFSDLQSYVNLVHGLGGNARAVVGSLPMQCDLFNNASWKAAVQTLNASIISSWNVSQGSGGLGADALIDFYDDPTIGQTNGSTGFCNTVYSPSPGQHPTLAAMAILGAIEAAAIAPFMN